MEKEDYQAIILDSLPHWAMLINGKERTILAANKLAKESGSIIQGQCWDDFGHRQYITDEQKELIERHPERKIDSCIKCNFCEADEAVKDNKTYTIEKELDGIMWRIFWVPVEGDIYLHYAIDITEEKKLEKIKLEDEKLKSTIKTLGAITHEIAQPLMAVMGNIEMLEMGDDDFKDKVFIKRIKTELEKMSNIVHKLQNITQIKSKYPGPEGQALGFP